VVEPMLQDPLIEFVGEIGDAEKPAFLGGARALLFPVCWPEPFGLVMIEAMACGTPVVAFGAGAAPEVVDEGVTGFIVDDEDAAVAAVRALVRLDRREVRRRFDRRFSAMVMGRAYLDVYADRLAKATYAADVAEDFELDNASGALTSLAQIA